MSKELKNITESVMGQIHQGKIRMRPKLYFIIGSIFTFIGLVLSILTTIFLISFIRFSFLARGPMGEYKAEELLAHFSWLGPTFAILGLVIGIWLLRRYDFSYKIDFRIMITGTVLAIIVAGIVLDMTGLNTIIFHRGKVQRGMRQYLEENNTQPNQEWRFLKNNQ
jgi:phosphoglycerol transferase MdoB-like AlkP superfamily enzyme